MIGEEIVLIGFCLFNLLVGLVWGFVGAGVLLVFCISI